MTNSHIAVIGAALATFALLRPAPIEGAEAPGVMQFVVHAAQPARLPEDKSGEWLELVTPSFGYAALGTVMAPVYGGALILGGLLLAPGSLIIYGVERATWKRAVGALRSASIDTSLTQALERRATNAALAVGQHPVHAEVTLTSYGLVGAKPERVCFVVAAEVVAQSRAREILRATVRIDEGADSNDAPPPQCASLEGFARDDGRLVRDTAADYAEVLAALILERIATAMKP